MIEQSILIYLFNRFQHFDVTMFTIFIALLLFTSSRTILRHFGGIGGDARGSGFGEQAQHFGSECYHAKTCIGVVVSFGKITAFFAKFFLDQVSYTIKSPKTNFNNIFFIFILAAGVSVYANVSFLGDYDAYHAVDGRLSPENSDFFHSDLEVDPCLRIQLKLPDNSDFEPHDILEVVMYQR